MTRHLFLLGLEGIGKTELIVDLLNQLRNRIPLKIQVGGFYTRSVRRGTEAKCFGHNVVTIQTERTGQLSRLKDGTPGLPVLDSRFVINVPMFDRIIMEELQFRPGRSVVILDELGKMQLCSQQLCNRIPSLLNHETFVLGVIPKYESVERYEVIQHIFNRSDTEVREITKSNRDLTKWVLRREVFDVLSRTPISNIH